MGPQSEADAYEMLAFRDRRRRESTASATERPEIVSGHAGRFNEASYLPTPPSSSSELNKKAMAGVDLRGGAIGSHRALLAEQPLKRSASQDKRDYEKDEREVFSKLEKPRVRYDVEVVTKLIVYTGKHDTKCP